VARLHLVEFEDLQWFPKAIRNYMTDFLQFAANKFDFYKTITPILKNGVEASGTNTIIDLASGGGGGWLKLSEHIAEEMPDVTVHLTDFYPNIAAFERTKAKNPDVFSFEEKSVNALDVPKELIGLRTQFLSFHHFKPDEARQILQNAVDAQCPIAIFEAQKRSVGDFIKFFFSPINVVFSTPFIRPFSFGRILFTYLIPIVPIFVWWDGLVSVLRTYSDKEMNELIAKLKDNESFEWEVSFVKNGPVKIYYTLGIPKS
jgi:hypothetical protein